MNDNTDRPFNEIGLTTVAWSVAPAATSVSPMSVSDPSTSDVNPRVLLSASITTTRLPSRAEAAAMLAAVTVFPSR